jgi:hypothetical protein
MPTADHPCPCDGTTLATSVRSLAMQVHRSLSAPAAGDAGPEDLARQVAQLQRCLEDRPPSDLARWVELLRRQIEAHGTAA